MSVEISPEVQKRIDQAYYMWLATVRADGQPQPTPVWFVWENGTFLIYSNPAAQKLHNIRSSAKVALSFTDAADAETFLVVMGEAVIDESAPPPIQHPLYFAKYEQGIGTIGMTPASFAQTFSTAIRITPTRIRTE